MTHKQIGFFAFMQQKDMYLLVVQLFMEDLTNESISPCHYAPR